MAPELIENRNYGLPVDIWSLGILALEIANQEKPNGDIFEPKKISASLENDLPKVNSGGPSWTRSKDFKDFVNTCL